MEYHAGGTVEVFADSGCEFQNHVIGRRGAEAAPADQGHIVVLIRGRRLEQGGVFIREVRIGEMLEQEVMSEGDGGRVPGKFIRDLAGAVDTGELPEVGREMSVEEVLLMRRVLKVSGEMPGLLAQMRGLVPDRSVCDDLAIVQAEP